MLKSLSPWLQKFQSLPSKDRQPLQWLAITLICFVLWFWNIAPALKTYQQAPLQLAQLEQQTEHLKKLQEQALALQKAPRLKVQDASATLAQSVTDIFGRSVKLSLDASRATLNLTNVSAEALAQLLTVARNQAQALPTEAHLQKTSTGSQELWRGTLILSLPTQ